MSFALMHIDGTAGWQSLLSSGRHSLANGDYRSAVQSFSSVILKTKSIPHAMIDGLIGRATALTMMQEIDGAISDLNSCLAIKSCTYLHTKLSEILWRRGVAYQATGKAHLFSRAIADYTSALADHPQCIEAFLSRGSLLFQLNQLHQAISDFSFAIKLNPRCSTAWKARAECWSRLITNSDAPPNAAYDWSRFMALDNRDLGRSLLHRAKAYSAMGDWSSAIVDYLKGIEVDPSLADNNFLHELRSRCPHERQDHDQSGTPADIVVRKRKSESNARSPQLDTGTLSEQIIAPGKKICTEGCHTETRFEHGF